MLIVIVIDNNEPSTNNVQENTTFKDIVDVVEENLNLNGNHIIGVNGIPIDQALLHHGETQLQHLVGANFHFTTSATAPRIIQFVINGTDQKYSFEFPGNMLFGDFVKFISDKLTPNTVLTKIDNKDILTLIQANGAYPLNSMIPNGSDIPTLYLEIAPMTIPSISLPEVKKKIIWDMHGIYEDDTKYDFNFPFHSLKFYCPNKFALMTYCDLAITTATNLDKINLILEKIPHPGRVGTPGEGKLGLRNMRFDVGGNEGKHNGCSDVMGMWICDVGRECRNPPNRQITWDQLFDPVAAGIPSQFYEMVKSGSRGTKPVYNFNHIFMLSELVVRSNPLFDQNLKNYEICMITCREKKGVSGSDFDSKITIYPNKPIQKYTGGSKMLEEIKNKQKNSLEINPSVLHVSEEQLYFYLTSPEEPSMKDVINSLTENEISQQLEIHQAQSMQIYNGGRNEKQSKTKKRKRRRRRNKKCKTVLRFRRPTTG
jgi:hypothetical protein